MGVFTLSNIFQNLQLQRIADAIENGQAGGEITIDVTGAGDMQGATASTAGVHGLVPAPQAGDQDKFLTGAGTFASPQGGGVDYSFIEQDTGLKWIDGKSIYQKTIDFGSMPVGQEKDVSHGITDLAFVVDLEFIVYNTNEVQWRLMPSISRGNIQAQSVYGVDSQYIFVLGGQSADINSDWSGIVTIRYTKTI